VSAEIHDGLVLRKQQQAFVDRCFVEKTGGTPAKIRFFE
jgi:hypothetical protein